MESLASAIRIQLKAQTLTEAQRAVLATLGIRCEEQLSPRIIHAYVEPAQPQAPRGYFVAPLAEEANDPPWGSTS